MSARLANLSAGLLMGLATLVFCGCAHRGGYPAIHAETVPLSELPAVVDRAVHGAYPQAQIVWVGRFGPKTDTACYSVEFTVDGKHLAAGIDAYGDLGRVDVPSVTSTNR